MASSTWLVTRQVPDQYDFTAPGDPVLGTIVHFQTGEGNDGSVFVAYAHYTVVNVRRMIAARAAVIDAVGALSSDPAYMP